MGPRPDLLTFEPRMPTLNERIRGYTTSSHSYTQGRGLHQGWPTPTFVLPISSAYIPKLVLSPRCSSYPYFVIEPIPEALRPEPWQSVINVSATLTSRGGESSYAQVTTYTFTILLARVISKSEIDLRSVLLVYPLYRGILSNPMSLAAPPPPSLE